MSLVDIVLIILIAAALIGAFLICIRSRKQGKRCCGDCTSCTGCRAGKELPCRKS